jgi:citrate synthase
MEQAKETTPATTGGAAAGTAAAGLRGVVAAQSSIGDVNGEQGILIYQGYNIHDLAEHSTFEEVVYLLWHGRLPKQTELDSLNQELRANYEVPSQIIDLLKSFPKEADPMDVLRTAVSALDFYDHSAKDVTREGALKTAVKLTAQMPTIVAAWERIRSGKDIIAPDKNANIATNFMYMKKKKRE